jgi:hypothetical protein
VGRYDSPLEGRLVFCVGARRSGTYWLQRIVVAHPGVSEVPGESHLFSHGIAPLLERFHHGPRGSGQVGRLYADRDALLDAARDFCDRMLGPFLQPGSTRLAERSPLHVQHLGLIGEIYPDARFVHIVRDGRDVVRSLLAQEWGPTTATAAAEEWRSSVLAAREQRPADGYLEVRYEELLADAEAGIREIYGHLGLDASADALELALAAARDASVNVDPTDARVAAGKWESSLSARELRDIEAVAGELLAELGYTGGGGGRRLPRLRRPRRRTPTQTEVVPGPESLFDELVGRLHRGEAERVGELLHPDVTVRIVTAEGEREERGPAARELLVKTVREDPAFAGRQVRGDVYYSLPTTGGLISYELGDGSRAHRLLFVTQRGELAGSVSIYPLRGH